MNALKIMFVFLALGVSMNLQAQGKIVNNSNQQWIQYYEEVNFSSPWSLSADAGFRRRDLFSITTQYIARIDLGYQLNSEMKLTAGFANLGSYTSNKLSKLEFRPYEELMIKHKYSVIKIQHRLRIEECFFQEEEDGKIIPATTFNFRFRYRLMFNIPILKLSAKHPDHKLSLNAGDEIFLNAGHTIVNNIFDQNRILVGPAWQINKFFTITLTYNNQFAATKSSGTYNHTDVFWLGIKHKFSVKNHKKNL
jgi:hypothetical protein